MPNRTLCEVLEEMRTTYKTRNFASLLGLIEEAQSMGNRMEAALFDQSSVKALDKKRRELKYELKKSSDILEKAIALAQEANNDDLVEGLQELADKSKPRDW